MNLFLTLGASVSGAEEAIKAIPATVSDYFPYIIGAVATITAMGAVLSFIRRAA